MGHAVVTIIRIILGKTILPNTPHQSITCIQAVRTSKHQVASIGNFHI